jgi:NAD(P)-dependent dehydrogenase (short-subunit alcohol dehydrogenase family)
MRGTYGPAEAFTPQQLAQIYDINVLSTQRVNRAALPFLRKQDNGLVVRVSSTSTRGGTPPYLGPYFAAKAGMDALAVSYAGELARWNIETRRSRCIYFGYESFRALWITGRQGALERVRVWTYCRSGKTDHERFCINSASRCRCIGSRKGYRQSR